MSQTTIGYHRDDRGHPPAWSRTFTESSDLDPYNSSLLVPYPGPIVKIVPSIDPHQAWLNCPNPAGIWVRVRVYWDPHQAWLNCPNPAGIWVRVRVYWHRAPVQRDAVQDLLRATAAQMLPFLDIWNLTPQRPWLTAARRLAGAGLLPLPEAYEPATHFSEYFRLLPGHSFRFEVGLSEKPESLETSSRDTGDSIHPI